MTSIYEQALGSQFQMLHPKIRERFGFDSKDHIASIGEGVMEEIWYAPWGTASLYRHDAAYYVSESRERDPVSD